jgi:hypothetical protein
MGNDTNNKFIHDVVSQDVFDNFNSFIFSKDKKLLGKLQSKQFFCDHTKHVLGDVVELGVFKGSGMISWLKTLEFSDPARKIVIGFDSFDYKTLVETISTQDKATMNDLFEKRDFNNNGYEIILTNILQSIGYTTEKYKLVVGNVHATLKPFLDENPGFRASIINFDLDLEEPTEYALNMLWPRVSKGGVLIFDEYGVHEWTESNAVDRFIEKHNLTLIKTPWHAPSAYIVKT